MRLRPRPLAASFPAAAAFVTGCLLGAATGVIADPGPPADAVWVQIPAPPNTPPMLGGQSAILDPVRDRMIVEGGAVPPYDLWSMTLSGDLAWSRLTPAGTLPGPRDRPGVIYDPAGERMIAFGGLLTDPQVWSLALASPEAWTELAVQGSGPGPRSEQFTAFDAARRRLIVFGGWSPSGLMNDVWALDLDDPPTWSQLAIPPGPAPTPRSALAGIYDPVRDRLVLYGGFDNLSSFPPSVWGLPMDGSAGWQVIEEAGPGGTYNQGRRYHTAIYDPDADRMVVHGGSGSGDTPKSETWSFDLASNTWAPLVGAGSAPAQRLHSAIHDPALQRMITFGGNASRECWSLSLGDLPAWTRLSPPAAPAWPGPRLGASSVYLSGADGIYLFAGWGTLFSEYNDVWRLQPHPDPVWTPVATSVGPPAFQRPSARRGAGLVYDSPRDQLVVVGGPASFSDDFATDVWTLRLSDGLWTRLLPAGTAPGSREGAAVIYDPVRDRILLFGGEVNDTHFGHTHDDLWQLTLGASPAWTQLAPSGGPPLSRSWPTSFYDPVRDRFVILGGRHKEFLTGQDLDDIWALELAGTPTWVPQAASGTPGPQFWQAGAYDASRDRVVLFSSVQAGAPPWTYNPVWTLSLEDLMWTPLSVLGGPPGFRYTAAAAWDLAGDQLVLFGGNGGMLFDETWTLQFSNPTVAVVSLVSADAVAGRVTLVWQGALAPGTTATVQRSAPGEGWAPIATIFADGSSRFSFTDRDVQAGARLGYRLGIREVGAERPVGETWVDVPGSPGLALGRVYPSPTSGTAFIPVRLPDDAPARLEVWDVAGRRRAVQDLRDLGAGSHLVRLDATRSLPPGLYWARLVHGAEVRSARIAVAR